eukprot:3367409-Pleurochrysis_carterae.AAC.2
MCYPLPLACFLPSISTRARREAAADAAWPPLGDAACRRAHRQDAALRTHARLPPPGEHAARAAHIAISPCGSAVRLMAFFPFSCVPLHKFLQLVSVDAFCLNALEIVLCFSSFYWRCMHGVHARSTIHFARAV